MGRRLQNGWGRALGVTLFFLFGVIIVYHALLSFSYSVGPNYRNVSVDTRVNITNAAPEILLVTVENPVTLTAGSTHHVECNVTVRDWNGYSDVDQMWGYFYYTTNVSTSPDNNNSHYTNTSCTLINGNGDYANYTCGFDVYYYAVPGTWICNVSVNDSYGYNDTASNTTTINQLLALNITPSLIDYGNLSIGDTSANKTANVSNFGNAPINVSVKGYGLTEGDGLSFVCQQGNITIENERFSVNASDTWTTKTPLNVTFQPIAGLTIPKQTVPGILSTNTTYWQLYVPPNPFGVCNGTVVFQAEAA